MIIIIIDLFYYFDYYFDYYLFYYFNYFILFYKFYGGSCIIGIGWLFFNLILCNNICIAYLMALVFYF
jgi:hypothetical protein